jgi:hypothetical protein
MPREAPDLQVLALAAGATQLGSAGTLHYILTGEQLARFVALWDAPALPPPPPY